MWILGTSEMDNPWLTLLWVWAVAFDAVSLRLSRISRMPKAKGQGPEARSQEPGTKSKQSPKVLSHYQEGSHHCRAADVCGLTTFRKLPLW